MQNRKSDPQPGATGAGREQVGAHNCTTSCGLLNAKDAAAYLRIGSRLLWSLTNQGDIAHVRVGARGVRYQQRDLDAYIARNRKGGPRG